MAEATAVKLVYSHPILTGESYAIARHVDADYRCGAVGVSRKNPYQRGSSKFRGKKNAV